MMPFDHLPRVLLITLVTSSSTCYAQTDQTSTSTPTIGRPALSESELLAAKAWALTADEWRRVETLRKGIGGYWDQNLDPVTLLGIHASSETERRIYAEKLVELERKLYLGLQAFEESRSAAWKRLYPEASIFDLLPQRPRSVDITRSNPFYPIADRAAAPAFVGDRQAYFTSVSLPCPQCRSDIDRLMASAPAFPVDIYFVDANDDLAIKKFAMAMNIPIALVQARHVTLNHDQGLHLTVGVSTFPALYQTDGKRFDRVSLGVAAEEESGADDYQ